MIATTTRRPARRFLLVLLLPMLLAASPWLQAGEFLRMPPRTNPLPASTVSAETAAAGSRAGAVLAEKATVRERAEPARRVMLPTLSQEEETRMALDPHMAGVGRAPGRPGEPVSATAPAGTTALQLQVASEGAQRLRALLEFQDDAPYRVRSWPVGQPERAQSVARRMDDGVAAPTLWTATTSGDRQVIEVERLAPATRAWTVSIGRISHLTGRALPLESLGIGTRAIAPEAGWPSMPGDAAYCQVDASCALSQVSASQRPALETVSESVALILATLDDGYSYYCTGTLLNTGRYPLPVLSTAYHCTDGLTDLETYWSWKRPSCGGASIDDFAQVPGGATILMTSLGVDTSLIQLNRMPPPSAVFAGWDANLVAPMTPVATVHHPAGDLRKISLGTMVRTTPYDLEVIDLAVYPAGSLYETFWTVGITEQGSSGSALLTYDGSYGAYVVRGVLTGSNSSCGSSSGYSYHQQFARAYAQLAPVLNDPYPRVLVYEFYAPSLDHYFRTANEVEAQYLAARPELGWLPTGENFVAYARQGGPAEAQPVCRFYGSMNPGPNSHFYTGQAVECDWLKTLQQQTPADKPRWNFEEIAFAIPLPTGGACPASAPAKVYRTYNRRAAQNDSNHRYTTRLDIYQSMIAKGWAAEGVVMCALQ